MPFQDVAKSGLKFGDEDEDPAEEKARQKELTEQYKPLLEWFKKEVGEIVRNGGFPFLFFSFRVDVSLMCIWLLVVISNRLVTSPCAIVADTYGYTANMEKMLSTSLFPPPAPLPPF